MHTYRLIEPGPYIQVLYGANVIDESGPWESIASATEWAKSYVDFKNSDATEPVLTEPESSTMGSASTTNQEETADGGN
jgi:hypothetical protein